MSFTFCRYGHLNARDADGGAHPTAEVMHDTEDASNTRGNTRGNTILFPHVARTPDDSDERVSDAQPLTRTNLVGAAGLEPTTSAVCR